MRWGSLKGVPARLCTRHQGHYSLAPLCMCTLGSTKLVDLAMLGSGEAPPLTQVISWIIRILIFCDRGGYYTLHFQNCS